MSTPSSTADAVAVLERVGVVIHESALVRTSATTMPQRLIARRRSALRRTARQFLQAVGRSSLGTRLLLLALEDPAVCKTVAIHISNKVSANASFEVAVGHARSLSPSRFSDCAWLFSSNPLNHGLARLEFDEAAYLFELVASIENPRVVELGRFRGGTTFLLAAAGGHLLSIDLDLEGDARRAPELVGALERFGLRQRVQLVVADSRAYPTAPDTVDVVFVDGDHSYDGVLADFEHWWPSLRRGGHMIFHDADRRYPWIEGVADAIERIAERSDVGLQACPSSLAHAVKA